MCVCAWLQIFLHLNTIERGKSFAPGNVIIYETLTHTYANSNETFACALSLVFAADIRWVGFFVKFAFGVCFVFARAICSCTANKVGRVFNVGHTKLMEFFSSFPLCLALRVLFILQVFLHEQHFIDIVNGFSFYRRNVLQPMWERDGDLLCFSNSQSFSLSYTNCGRTNIFNWKSWKLCYPNYY